MISWTVSTLISDGITFFLPSDIVTVRMRAS